MNEKFYYIKYLKYKMKYLKEKEMLIGGKEGETDDSIFFISSSPDFSFLSNFYISDFSDPDEKNPDGTPIVFNCNEKYFMYQKAKTCNLSKEVLEHILRQTDPKEIREAGGPPSKGGVITMSPTNMTDWEEKKLRVMKRGLGLKFSKNPLIKKQLIDTGRKNLYEANKHDRYWGIGFEVDTGLTKSKIDFGENQLGILLMEIREEIKNPNFTVAKL